MIIESPYIQEIGAEFKRTGCVETILAVLETRFGEVPASVKAGLAQVKEQEKFARLTRQAVLCPDLQVFEDAVRQELPAPQPTSTRGKRRSRKSPE